MHRAKEALVDKLKTTPAIAALVATRIYPYAARIGSGFPQICFKLTGRSRPKGLGRPRGPFTDTYEIACWAESGKAAEELGGLVAAALDMQRGTWAGLVVQGCFVTDEEEDDEPQNQQQSLYVHKITVEIVFNI